MSTSACGLVRTTASCIQEAPKPYYIMCTAAGMAPAVTVDRRSEGFAVATIAREPINSMDLSLWRELLATLEALEADTDVRGVIWASGLKRDVFTAGNDLKVGCQKYCVKSVQKELWLCATVHACCSTPLHCTAPQRSAVAQVHLCRSARQACFRCCNAWPKMSYAAQTAW